MLQDGTGKQKLPKSSKLRHWLKSALKLVAALVGLIVLMAGLYIATHSGIGVNRDNLPKFVHQDFIDLKNIDSISQFRSDQGHDFSGGDEACRSMKHYYTQTTDPNKKGDGSNFQEIIPKPDGMTDIPIYSPVNGRIMQIVSENSGIGRQIYIIPDDAKGFTIRLFHIYPIESLKAGILGYGGSHVQAGEKIGVIANGQGTDVAVQIGNLPWSNNYISYFEVMGDEVFGLYQARGIGSRNDLIISRDSRDANPKQCDGNGRFIYPSNYDYNAENVKLKPLAN